MARAPRQFRYDPRMHAYRGPNGRTVAWSKVREHLDESLTNAGERAKTLTQQLREQKISLATWELQMKEIVRQAHGYGAVLARGGHGRMSDADWLRVAREVKSEFRYLRDFARRIESGKYGTPPDGRVPHWAASYAQAGRGTYHDWEAAEMKDRGYDRERSIRHASDSCPGCIKEARRGWVKIGRLVRIGRRDCLNSCKCSKRYRNSRTGETSPV